MTDAIQSRNKINELINNVIDINPTINSAAQLLETAKVL
jgi:hypothetical protein